MEDVPLTLEGQLALFDKVVAGELQESERERLEQGLKASDSMRAAFRNYVAMHVELASVVRMARARQAVYDEIRVRASESKLTPIAGWSAAATNAFPSAQRVKGSSTDSTPLWPNGLWWLGLAAAVAAVVGLPLALSPDLKVEPLADEQVVTTLSPSRPPAPVATLSSQNAATWKGLQLVNGGVFREGDTIALITGEAQISVGFGAEIAATAPCSLRFLSPDRVKLEYGDIAVHVAEWATGFTVVTDTLDVVDLGTTFTVSAAPGKATEAAVLKGVVRVHSSTVGEDHPRGRLVTEGQQVSIDDKGLIDNVELLDVDRRLRELDFGVGAPYRPVALNNTGLGLSIGDEDLHWRIVAGPEESFGGPQFSAVCPPERGYLPNYPKTSQWISIADWKTAAPNAIYTFQTTFDLQDYDLDTIQLFGRFLADNGIVAVRVNGQPVHVDSWVDNERLQPFGDLQFRFVNVIEGLVNGQNIIEIDVRNGMMRADQGKSPPMKAIPNPMALRVEWYAFGRQLDLASADTGSRALPGRFIRAGSN